MTSACVTTCVAALFAVLLPRPGTPDAKELAALAPRLGIPMPPKDARLVLARTAFPSDTGVALYTPAFLLEEKADGNATVLRGFNRETVRSAQKGPPVWRKFSLAPIDPKTAGYVVEFGLDAYVCAAQTAARGDTETARDILKRFDENGNWFGHEPLPPVYRDPRMLLGQYWIESSLLDLISQGPAQWRAAHDGLKAVCKVFPFLATPDRRELVDDLATTLRARPPAAGTTEALLLDWATRPSEPRVFGYTIFSGNAPSAPARAVIARGFTAVPDLIALLDDRRLTTHQTPAFNRTPAFNLRVGGLAWDLLREVSGTDVDLPDDESVADAWRAWWAKVRTRPERGYYLETVFEVKDGKIIEVRNGPAHVLGQKFPDTLPALCTEFTDRAVPSARPLALAEALSASSLPKEKRVKTLAAFAQRGSLGHRRSVLRVLADLDRAECAEVLLPLVEKLPKDIEGRYLGSPEAGFGYEVARLGDDAVWRAYLVAARRASVGLRVEMLDSISDARPGVRNREQRLAFLAMFLDDEVVRDVTVDPKKFDGASGIIAFPRITVRDYAALLIAGMLGLRDRPDESWGTDKWEELRRKVRGELAREKLPVLVPPR